MCSIGDKEGATTLATTKYEDTTLTTNRRLDAIFAMFRIAYFHGCNVKEMGKAITKVYFFYKVVLSEIIKHNNKCFKKIFQSKNTTIFIITFMLHAH